AAGGGAGSGSGLFCGCSKVSIFSSMAWIFWRMDFAILSSASTRERSGTGAWGSGDGAGGVCTILICLGCLAEGWLLLHRPEPGEKRLHFLHLLTDRRKRLGGFRSHDSSR